MNLKTINSPANRRARLLSGFGLIDVTVGILLLSIIAAIAIPKYGASLSRFRVEMACKRIAQDLDLCRRHARMVGASATFEITPAKNSYRLLDIRSPLLPTGDHQTLLQAEPYVSHFGAIRAGQSESELQPLTTDLAITFDRFGNTKEVVELVICSGAEAKRVRLSTNGLVTIL